MNNDTGHIHQLAHGQAFEDFKAKIPILEMPVHGFTELGNAPVAECPNCKGTGVFRILPSGKRIPCKCTNPVA